MEDSLDIVMEKKYRITNKSDRKAYKSCLNEIINAFRLSIDLYDYDIPNSTWYYKETTNQEAQKQDKLRMLSILRMFKFNKNGQKSLYMCPYQIAAMTYTQHIPELLLKVNEYIDYPAVLLEIQSGYDNSDGYSDTYLQFDIFIYSSQYAIPSGVFKQIPVKISTKYPLEHSKQVSLLTT